MGRTFVYNSGTAPSKPNDVLDLELGIFFDGTLNNRRNTEIRKKVEGKGEFANKAPTSWERYYYDKYAKEDNSFGNDFTNVARKSFCCDENYTIYVEGIGTVDEKPDEGGGYRYGRGKTGIIEKVRNGCKAIADKVGGLTNNNKEIKRIKLTIDAFGFSRGAAAARNFLYNLQKREYQQEVYFPPIQGASGIEVDHNGYAIKKSWLRSNLLPRFGHLGTAMLDAGIKRDVIDKMEITVRFLGIYDTVASYDPECKLLPDFKDHIHKLHLHDLGAPEKAVHFTAMDEHRKNFSLTRFSPVKLFTGIERNLPGVHSDVGGSYNNDPLSIQSLSLIAKKNKDVMPINPEKVTEREKILLDTAYLKSSLKELERELKNEGFYTEGQLSYTSGISLYGPQSVLVGTRYVYRGYSLIPLHFMCDYAKPLLNRNRINLKLGKVLSDYALKDDFLEEVKEYLYTHTIKRGKDWVQSRFRREKEDKTLRTLRNKYLHRSAKLNTVTDELANAPAKDRKRKEF